MNKTHPPSILTYARHFILLLVLALFMVRISTLVSNYVPDLIQFVQQKGDYDKLRLEYIEYADPIEAAAVLPRNARVEFSKKEWDFPKIASRFILYPRRLVDHGYGDYFFDVNLKKFSPPSSWKTIDLPSGASVYAKPGFNFVHNKKVRYSILKTWGMVAGVSIFNVIAGLCILSMLNIPLKEGGLFWYGSSAYLLGFLFLNGVLWLAMLMGFPFQKFYILSLWLAGIGILFWKARPSFKKSENSILDYSRLAFLNFKETAGKKVFVLMALICAFIFFSIGTMHMLSWDAMSHWMMKSKVIFYEKGLVFDYTHLNFYPLLWSLNIAVLFEYFGADFYGLAYWTVAVLFLTFIGQFLGAVNFLRLKKIWHWLPLMLFITFFLNWNFFVATAEPLLMCYLMASIALGCAWLQGRQQSEYLKLACWMVLGLNLVKFEGWVTTIIISAAFIASAYKKISLSKAGIFLSIILSTIIPVVFWIKWTGYMGYNSEISHLNDPVTLEKVIIVFMLVVRQFSPLSFMYTSLTLIILLTCIFCFRAYDRSEIFLILTFTGLALFSCIAVVGWPIDSLENQLQVAGNRLFFHAAPALCLWWGSLFLKT
jgi:hypothetical protein